MSRKTCSVIIFLIAGIILILGTPEAFAHLEHLPHYNGMQTGTENYIVQQGLEPEYAVPGELTEITFSVQDYRGNDMEDVKAMVEIYKSSGERVYALPWTIHDIGDFSLHYVFQKAGNYQLVLSVANGPVNLNNIDPPRTIITSSSGCSCERVISNINISTSFGIISNSVMFVALILASAVAGSVLWMNYHRGNLRKKRNYRELLKYSVMLAAIGGGTYTELKGSDGLPVTRNDFREDYAFGSGGITCCGVDLNDGTGLSVAFFVTDQAYDSQVIEAIPNIKNALNNTVQYSGP